MTYHESRFTFDTPRFQGSHRWRQYLCIVYIFGMLLFLSCQAEQGNYTAVSQNGQYVYGVWKARTAKAAKNLSRQIHQALAEGHLQIDSLSLITTEKPIDLLPANGEATHWVRAAKPSVDVGKDLYKNVIGGNPELYHSYGFVEGLSLIHI